jgi:hypothetical protein
LTLPNFIIGGVPKSGTTSLYEYLRQHPDVYMPKVKEPRFFLLDPADPEGLQTHGPLVPIRTMAEYEALFDGVTTETAVGEATPFYMTSSVARERIHAELPDVKLIFCLREPIARAYSAYWVAVNKDSTPRVPVEEFLTETSDVIQNGRYNIALMPWYEKFDPSRIKVVLLDDLVTDALLVFQDICRFLGVDDTFVPDTTIHNKRGVLKNPGRRRFLNWLSQNRLAKKSNAYLPPSFRATFVKLQSRNFEKPPPLPPEMVQRLSAYYREDIEQLEELLGRDLSSWKRG